MTAASTPREVNWEFGRQFGGALMGHEHVDQVDPAVVEAVGAHLRAGVMLQAAEMAKAIQRFGEVVRESGVSFAQLLAAHRGRSHRPWKHNKQTGYGR